MPSGSPGRILLLMGAIVQSSFLNLISRGKKYRLHSTLCDVSRRKFKRIMLFWLVLFVITIVASSCTKSTESEKGIISGSIHLDGETDHSGIFISIYHGDIIPEELSRINNTYPQLAFPIEDKHIFDHRAYTPIQIVQTDQIGRFETTPLDFGKYIICYYKEGWGYNIIYDIDHHSGETNIDTGSKVSNHILYSDVQVPPVVSGEYRLLTGHSYVIAQNTIAIEGSSVILEPGSKLLLKAGTNLSCHGSFFTQNDQDYAMISSYDMIYSPGNKPAALGSSIKIYNQSPILSSLIISFLSDGLDIRCNDQLLENIAMCYNATSMVTSQTSNVGLRNSLIFRNTPDGQAAVYVSGASEFETNNCLFFENQVSLKNKAISTMRVSSCYFYGDAISVENSVDSSLLMMQSEIDNNGIGVDNTANSNIELRYNTISSRICLNNWRYPDHGSSAEHGWIKGANNNFEASRYAIESRAYYYNAGGDVAMDFRNNYWGATSAESIANLIIDGLDLGEPAGNYHYSIIDFSAFKHNPIANAGLE